MIEIRINYTDGTCHDMTIEACFRLSGIAALSQASYIESIEILRVTREWQSSVS